MDPKSYCECEKSIPDSVATCPHCGVANPRFDQGKAIGDQGFQLMREAKDEYGWKDRFGETELIWGEGRLLSPAIHTEWWLEERAEAERYTPPDAAWDAIIGGFEWVSSMACFFSAMGAISFGLELLSGTRHVEFFDEIVHPVTPFCTLLCVCMVSCVVRSRVRGWLS